MKFIQKSLFLLLFLSSGLAFGQITEDPEDRRNPGKEPNRATTPEGDPLPFSQRLRFGGGISGLSIGNPFSIGLSPVLAYQASERAVLGVGINYIYTRFRVVDASTNQRINLTANQYGGRVFGLYEIIPSVIQNLYAHGELETNSLQDTYKGLGVPITRTWVSAPLVGLTYSQRIGRLAGINLSALYNLNYNANTLQAYSSPWVFRISFF
ncbi:hypothetical protein [Tellurirhabdus rosea]|uniref:hypothetical protein n=1 Tax=Tellurirhabdus rosea TaxID=2674997 RepID=UPI00224FF9D8|nr:hypothetical protein [Tellurirhabdus rosea]